MYNNIYSYEVMAVMRGNTAIDWKIMKTVEMNDMNLIHGNISK